MTTKGVVVYDSGYGNTEKIAKALAAGLEEGGVETDVFRVDGVDVEKLAGYDLIAVGGPTHIAGVSKPMKAFLERASVADIRGKNGFCFDTRNPSRFNAFDINSAAKKIESRMKRRGVKMVRRRESALVEGREGPLHEGAEERFRRIGSEIAGAIR